MKREEFIEDVLIVTRFIGWHDPKHLMGGYTADKALESFSRLIRIPKEDLIKIIGKEDMND